jgi:serine/threonine protein kinase
MPGSHPSSMPYSQVFEKYHLDHNLGHGAFGIVSQVTENATGKAYARKQIDLPKGQDWVKFRNSILREVNNMRRVACAHTVNVENFREAEMQAMEIYMTPVADGDLKKILEGWVKGQYPKLKAETVYSWLGCLFQALEFVHSRDVVHKDIKPSNILIKDEKIYLADFGLSRSFEGGPSGTYGEFAGTPEYQAPEYFNGQKHGRPVDIFALGCVFSEILTTLRNKDLDEFKEKRSVREITEIRVYSFHRNIKRVEEWVKGLNGSEMDNFLVDAILGMLKFDVDERKLLAEQALMDLKSWEELCCVHGC